MSLSGGHPPPRALFVDCDDCVYQNEWRTAIKITDSISAYTEKLGVSRERAYELYLNYGTCIKGLLTEGHLDECGVEDFLHTVHQISYEDISPDPRLREVLESACDALPTWIFTASTKEHAQRCLQRVGIADLPWKGDSRTLPFFQCVTSPCLAPMPRLDLSLSIGKV